MGVGGRGVMNTESSISSCRWEVGCLAVMEIKVMMSIVMMIVFWSMWSSYGDAISLMTIFLLLLSMNKYYFKYPAYGRHCIFQLVWIIAYMHNGWKQLKIDPILLKVTNSDQKWSKIQKLTKVNKRDQMWLKVKNTTRKFISNKIYSNNLYKLKCVSWTYLYTINHKNKI